MLNIFEFQDYKAYLTAKLETGPKKGWGVRSAMAEAMGCQTAYVSQVLSGGSHFSLEQIEALNPFFEHTDQESNYFLLLVQKSRAGTPGLRNYFSKQINQAREDHLSVKGRVQIKPGISRENQALYYSHWSYAAIHVAVSVPSLQDVSSLCKHFRLSEKQVTRVLEALVRMGLVNEKKNRYSIGKSSIHLEDSSPHISRHHTQWRLKAVDSLDRYREKELHYTSVVSLSESDVAKIKDLCLSNITSVKETVRKSPEEVVYCFSMDFFEV